MFDVILLHQLDDIINDNIMQIKLDQCESEYFWFFFNVNKTIHEACVWVICIVRWQKILNENHCHVHEWALCPSCTWPRKHSSKSIFILLTCCKYQYVHSFVKTIHTWIKSLASLECKYSQKTVLRTVWGSPKIECLKKNKKYSELLTTTFHDNDIS